VVKKNVKEKLKEREKEVVKRRKVGVKRKPAKREKNKNIIYERLQILYLVLPGYESYMEPFY
tara:strand:+ start:147 stop:332 length:186 start_codon:yes stop_codon:yes gene_type:complete